MLITCVILGSHHVAVFSLCFLVTSCMSLKAVVAEHAAKVKQLGLFVSGKVTVIKL